MLSICVTIPLNDEYTQTDGNQWLLSICVSIPLNDEYTQMDGNQWLLSICVTIPLNDEYTQPVNPNDFMLSDSMVNDNSS